MALYVAPLVCQNRSVSQRIWNYKYQHETMKLLWWHVTSYFSQVNEKIKHKPRDVKKTKLFHTPDSLIGEEEIK